MINIDTNINQKNNLKATLTALKHTYSTLQISPIYSNPTIGFTGPEFYNLIINFETTQTITEITTFLHNVETNQKRTRQNNQLDSQKLDLDLLLYNDHVLHEENIDVPQNEILEHPYMLIPLN